MEKPIWKLVSIAMLWILLYGEYEGLTYIYSLVGDLEDFANVLKTFLDFSIFPIGFILGIYFLLCLKLRKKITLFVPLAMIIVWLLIPGAVGFLVFFEIVGEMALWKCVLWAGLILFIFVATIDRYIIRDCIEVFGKERVAEIKK
ncbi:hypothetical protein [Geosporobacter ferrireducens]|uniref:Uncharacterized protein n=1 Tax=Geosporobacter ferrireducens TaxID=1424294 RepID=A0A1D8GBQ7_9FIRM|nr:hypothetical protein [Geosporobacter ferrireducens]AOT68336.1 hypothetical protein Gferi_01250 [Geosporobacter ferrireducens]